RGQNPPRPAPIVAIEIVPALSACKGSQQFQGSAPAGSRVQEKVIAAGVQVAFDPFDVGAQVARVIVFAIKGLSRVRLASRQAQQSERKIYTRVDRQRQGTP